MKLTWKRKTGRYDNGDDLYLGVCGELGRLTGVQQVAAVQIMKFVVIFREFAINYPARILRMMRRKHLRKQCNTGYQSLIGRHPDGLQQTE